MKSLLNLVLLLTIGFFFISMVGCSSAVENWVEGPPQLDENGKVVSGGNFYTSDWYKYRVVKKTVQNLDKETKTTDVTTNNTTTTNESLPFQDENGWLLGYVINKTNWDQSVNIWDEKECIASFYVQGKESHPTYLMPSGEDFYYAYWNGKSPLKGDKPDWVFQVNPWKTVSLSIKNNNGTEQKKCAWYLY